MDDRLEQRWPALALLVAWIPFGIGGLLVIRTDTPPSLSPTLGMLSHALWAVGVVFLALGVLGHLRWDPTLRMGIAGYLSAIVLSLGTLHALQWVTWAYVDVRGSRESAGEHEFILDAVIVPFGAGHLLTYAIVVATGLALFGWALRRTAAVPNTIALAGVTLGSLTVVLAAGSMLAAVGGGGDGHIAFDIATLLLPVLYLWAAVAGMVIYRRTGLNRR